MRPDFVDQAHRRDPAIVHEWKRDDLRPRSNPPAFRLTSPTEKADRAASFVIVILANVGILYFIAHLLASAGICATA